MTSNRDSRDIDDGLDAFFAAARRDPGPTEDLMARVLADATAVQTASAARGPAVRDRQAKRPGLIEMLGGWLTVSGLAAACATGIVVGVAVPGLVDGTLGSELSLLLDGQTSIGFSGFDAVAFAPDFEVDP